MCIRDRCETSRTDSLLIATGRTDVKKAFDDAVKQIDSQIKANHSKYCLLYTSDAADETS
ncbi:hypothetical protein BALS_19775 [Bacillus altitudinis]|nr:hypothetical protein [Bacillus altitudinis]